MPRSIIHGDASFAYLHKIWGIPGVKPTAFTVIHHCYIATDSTFGNFNFDITACFFVL